MPKELRVYLRCLANAPRDIEAGMGAKANFNAILEDLEREHTRHNFNVLVLTEFHRGLDEENVTNLGRLVMRLGLDKVVSFKKDCGLDEQGPLRISKKNPDSAETIVCSKFPPELVHVRVSSTSSERPPDRRSYPLINGQISLYFHDPKRPDGPPMFGVVVAHTTHAHGKSHQPQYDMLKEELHSALNAPATDGRPPNTPLLGIGDFNLTDGAAAALQETHPKLLEPFRASLSQADFVCTPLDRIDEADLPPPEETVGGHTRACFDHKDDDATVRLCSSLGKVFGPWKRVAYFDPVLHEDITGLDAQELLEFYKKRGVDLDSKPSIFDHAACLAVVNVGHLM